MAINKSREFKIKRGKVEEVKPKTLIVEVSGKYYPIKPDNPFYTIVDYYGKVVSRIES